MTLLRNVEHCNAPEPKLYVNDTSASNWPSASGTLIKSRTARSADSTTIRSKVSASEPIKWHIYDYVVTDSNIERTFVTELDTSPEVVVYAKLPKGFAIPTPVGSYNPDWVISFKEGTVKHVYFVAETKGTLSSMQLRDIEKMKIECARKYFTEINQKINPDIVKYDVVNDYGKLMDIVGL